MRAIDRGNLRLPDNGEVNPEQIKKHPELFERPKTGNLRLDRHLDQVESELRQERFNSPKEQERNFQRNRRRVVSK